jgi:hypothetical protein
MVNKALWSALDAATRRSELNEAARKLMQAKTALKRLEQRRLRRSVRRPRRLPPERLPVLINLETRLLEVLHDSLGELVPGIVGRVLLQQPV